MTLGFRTNPKTLEEVRQTFVRLRQLLNFDLSTPTNNHVLSYNSTTEQFETNSIGGVIAGGGADTTAIHVDAGSEISNITAKATPVSADFLVIEDSAASNAKKSITIGDIDVVTGMIADDAVTYAKIQNVVADNRILGNVGGAGGIVAELDKAAVLTLINVADGANAYSHPNHSGDVTSTGDGATVIGALKVLEGMIGAKAVTYAKIQDVSATNRILGRDTAGAGVIEEITPANLVTMLALDHDTDIGGLTSGDGHTQYAEIANTETISAVWTFGTTTKLQLRDSGIFLHSDADGSAIFEADVTLTLRGNTTTNVGVAGDIVLGDSTQRDIRPQTDLKMDLGTSSLRFNEAWLHELHVQQSVDNVSDPPTDAQLDSAFGTPAALGRGFIGTIDDADGNTNAWIVFTTDTSWFYLAKGTKAV